MLIFKVAYKKDSDAYPDRLLEDAGETIVHINPSTFSFLTSMRIATECKSHTPDAVIVYRMKDAVGALSARTLNQAVDKLRSPYPILFYIDDKTNRPIRVTTEVMNKIDVWIFESEEILDEWKKIDGFAPRRTEVIPRPAEDTPIAERTSPNDKPTLSYFGELGDCRLLGATLGAIAKQRLGGQVNIRVRGTGKARYIMPVVKLAKANALNVEWLGDEYDIDSELAKTDAWIVSSRIPAQIEKRLMANRRPGITAATVADLLDHEKYSLAADEARREYLVKYTPEKYIENIRSLLAETRQNLRNRHRDKNITH